MATDIIFIHRLDLSANIGPDCWGRSRPQPISISVHLHLTPDGFLSRAGQSDSVNDTINYGHLTKAVTQYVEGDGQVLFVDGVRQLIHGVAEKTFELAGEENGKAVRVLVELPKIIPLAQGGMAVEVTLTRERQVVQTKVYVKDLSFAVVIGVNEPERHEKQRVVVNLEVYERENSNVDYPGMVRLLASDVDCMDYLTLEKMAWEIALITCRLLGEQAEKVTIRAQKPSALSFGHSSGVEMTRKLADFETK